MKKITPVTLITVAVVLVLSLATFKLNDSLRVPTIFDGKFYNTVPIPKTQIPYFLKEKREAIPELENWSDSAVLAQFQYTEKLLDESNTTAFLVLRNDTLIYKKYQNGVKEGEATQIFSVTKVFVTALLGKAIKDGYIPDENVSVKKYFRDLKQPQFDSLTLLDLAQMRSGLNYDEYGNLLQTLRFYYKRNLTSAIYNAGFETSPGKLFKYKSIDTQILGECIRKALGKKKIIDYLSETIWNKLGMQDSAYFAVDSKLTRNLKYYGGLNMSARDLAKFGIMVMHKGKFNGKQIIPRNWLNYCALESNRSTSEDKYCLGWYYSEDDAENDIYYAAGFNGQIMLINAGKKVIIIRLGKDKGGVNWYPLLKRLSLQV